MTESSMLPALPALVGLVMLSACASSGTPPPKVDLGPAREAIEAARRVGADKKAPDPLGRAEAHLKEAEGLAAAARNNGAAQEAASLGRLAATEAEWAASLASMPSPSPSPRRLDESPGAARNELEARVRHAEEEQRRLEERVGLLLKELELTEQEVVRTKAKIKGQSKAEASSAIAEARVLLRRMADDKGRNLNLSRCQEVLDHAEQLLSEGDFSSAAFFAMKSQEMMEQARRLANDPAALDAPAPKKTYVVASDSANLRRAPSTTEPIVGQAPRGATVDARVVRGEW
ncbi:MAG: hypothetical protein ACHQNV_09855, partial [Vicinamibacteria bacterium]